MAHGIDGRGDGSEQNENEKHKLMQKQNYTATTNPQQVKISDCDGTLAATAFAARVSPEYVALPFRAHATKEKLEHQFSKDAFASSRRRSFGSVVRGTQVKRGSTGTGAPGVL